MHLARVSAMMPPPADPEPWLLSPPATASAADILACFRLILGRNPNREEWSGHSARAGEPLPNVVASYVNSLEFSRRGLLQQDLQGGVVETELPDFRIYSAGDDAAVGRPVRAGAYEPEVTAVFHRLLKPGMGVIDIGANIGYFTMVSAALVGPRGHVLAIEPNPRNARLLEASRRANGFAQVTLAQVAAGAEVGLLVLHATHSNGTTSTPSDRLADLLGAETVACVRADSLVAPDRRVDLIKLDVEGAEFKALQGCAAILDRWRPALISEFSPDMMQGISGVDGPTYLRHILARGYTLAVIQPDGTLQDCGTGWPAVMDAYQRRGTDHIDILATPA